MALSRMMTEPAFARCANCDKELKVTDVVWWGPKWVTCSEGCAREKQSNG